VAVLIVGLAAVAIQGTPSSSSPAAPGVAAPAFAPPPAAPPVDDQVSGWGETVTFDDGLQVQVAAPELYRPGSYSAGHDKARAVRINITVTNGGSQPFDPVVMLVNASHGGQMASPIFDSQNGIGGAPQTNVLPGKSTMFPVAFSIGDQPGELQVEVTPSFEYTDAVFVGTI
jgi:hypothetical protein